ncbi:amylopullulanase precursor [Ruminiclostridium hungatei]|uniref:Amylopullulanase n=1 Tax=Ruminiclostridium hungatei TaxID=48256 RepID=A0A1V4SMH9_RUMHU|nr:hypothetical protein [Ruminiclostridium hungatei]OPX45070.1 amylopullulanase precursor [Ruminiclostridium hungatei]
MRRFGKLAGFFVVFIAVIAAFCNVSFAASVGQVSANPDQGWRRYDDTDSRIKYSGSWLTENVSSNYNSTSHYTSTSDSNYTFKFVGTKFRIIGVINQDHPTNNSISIDGNIYTMSEYATSLQRKIILYEETNLSFGTHSVTVTSKSTGKFTQIDAIDIDETGYLVDINTPDAPTNLNAISGNKKVDLSWGSVEGAASYNVKRALTAGGPYTTIATTSAITYIDSNVNNDVKYYYVISAVVNGTESPNSNEASATPTAPEVIGNPGILEITMTNGQIKEYDLSGAELLAFLNWYDGKSDGTGKAYYTITKKNNIKPFLSRKEYIAFDKISSFEVKEYTE